MLEENLKQNVIALADSNIRNIATYAPNVEQPEKLAHYALNRYVQNIRLISHNVPDVKQL